MEHHGLYTDISSSFNNGLPATNIKYHLHNPQIPPQPPPSQQTPSHQTTPIYHQTHHHHVDQEPLQPNHQNLNLNLYPDDSGLFDNTTTLCTNNFNNINNSNNKTIEYSSRKYETNTGDSITYNINNINTNIVNNINNNSSNSSSNLGSINNSLTNGPNDFLCSPQYGVGAGVNKESEANPTIININNNNNNMMAPPYFYPPKMPVIAPINELNNKFGTSSWSTSNVNEYANLEPTVINNFEQKHTNKYQSSRLTQPYRYSEYPQPQQQQSQYTYNYGSYHPEGVQATPVQHQHHHQQQPNLINHNYDSYPHILRSKPTMMEETNRYMRTQHSTSHTPSFQYDLIYNDRSNRYYNSFNNNYMQQTPYYPVPPNANKSMLNHNLDYFQNSNTTNGMMKQVQLNPHQIPNPHYMNSRGAYPSPQYPSHSSFHHQSYPMNGSLPPTPNYDESYHHGSRARTFNDNHLMTNNAGNVSMKPYQPKLANASANAKNINSFNGNYQYYGNSPTTYNSSNAQPTIKHGPSPISNSNQKPRTCYYEASNPVMDINHPFVDLEEQINSSKILKTRDINTYNENHPMNYDCQEKYLMNRFLSSKTYPEYNPIEMSLAARDFVIDENSKNQNLREFLTTWNEVDDDEENHRKEINNNQQKLPSFEACKYAPPLNGVHQQNSVIVANVNNSTNNLPDILVDIEKPKPIVELDKKNEDNEEEVASEEKFYILETYEVPISELNKYKHLNVINRLPENVVPITENEICVGGVENSLKFIEEIESNREKYYKDELEFEVDFEAKEKVVIPTVVEDKSDVTADIPKPKSVIFKVPTCIPKYRKRKAYQHNAKAIASKRKKPNRGIVEEKKFKSLKTICVDYFNTKKFRNFVKTQLKVEAEKISTCTNSVIKFQAKSLKQICRAKAIECDLKFKPVTSLKDFSYKVLLSKNLLPQPKSLMDTCESFICNNRHLFLFEEIIQGPPKLQDLCKDILSETNIFIDVPESFCIVDQNNEEDDEKVFIVEEDSGKLADLFGDTQEFCVPEQTNNPIFLEETNDELGFYDENNFSTCTKSINNNDSNFDIDCVQCEEVIHVNEVIYKKEQVLEHLRAKYLNQINYPLVLCRSIVYKYIYYQRYIKLNENNRIFHKSKLFRNYLKYLKRKIEKRNCDNKEEVEEEEEIIENIPKIDDVESPKSDDALIISSSYSNEVHQIVELNNNHNHEINKESLAKENSQKHLNSNEISRELIRSNNSRPIIKLNNNKKRKLNFEECLLSIDKYYKKNTNSNNNKFSTNYHPNVIVNVSNAQEAPKKLIIPSYKIFDQNANNTQNQNPLSEDNSSNANGKQKTSCCKKIPFVTLERSLYIDKLAETYNTEKLKHL